MTSLLKPVPPLHKKLMLNKPSAGVREPARVNDAKLSESSFDIRRQAGALVSVERHKAVPFVEGEVSPSDHVAPLAVEPVKDTTILLFEGVRQSIIEWALDYGITPGIILARLHSGFPVADAITKPMRLGFPGQRLPKFHSAQTIRRRKPAVRRAGVARANIKRLTHDGRTLSLTEWARISGMHRDTLRSRLRAGWTLDAALTAPVHRGQRAAEAAGVSSDFAPSEGTGAGSTAQETPNLTFSGNDA